jgi:poly-gamma-glutamate synthesis protein (capsule biosynthesis protein)
MSLTLFLAGDVMTGRGIDQVLPHPGQPRIFEDYLRWATDYVRLAEAAHGRIEAPVDFSYIWGDALGELERRHPDARIINLETAVTASDAAAPKGINYRMNPTNISVLTAARIDCCVLANNHVLDWGEAGLLDTLVALDAAGIAVAGAGKTLADASRPAVIPLRPDCRVCVYGCGVTDSGIPDHWSARGTQPGIRLLPDLSERTAAQLAGEIGARRRPGDITILSVHWGSNWGYDVPARHRLFARKLIDLSACDILHGHSSHHPRAIEIYRGKLILYGCGDLINDYEGIGGREEYRGDLSFLYLPRLSDAGALEALTLVPTQMHRFRLRRAPSEDAEWLLETMNRESEPFGTRFALHGDNELRVEWM